MRVISGTARGTILNTLDGDDITRPTLDRVKESLFNIIQNNIVEKIVLDLFAGSGALGIESLSRGAKKVFFCDKSYEAINIITKNIEKTKFKEKSNIIRADYKKAIELLCEKNQKFDLIFIDPPYKLDLAVDATNRIIKKGLLQEDGIIIIETDNEEREITNIEKSGLKMYDIRKYGRVKLIFIV